MLQVVRPVLLRAPLLRPAFAARARIAPRPVFMTWRAATTKRYTAEHEWISFDDSDNIGTVGITDYAQKSLGDIVFVELSQETEVAKGEEIGAVESVKAASDIFAPVSGTVFEINEILADKPGLINQSPEEDGWLCKIKLANPQEIEELMTAEAYAKHCEGESEK